MCKSPCSLIDRDTWISSMVCWRSHNVMCILPPTTMRDGNKISPQTELPLNQTNLPVKMDLIPIQAQEEPGRGALQAPVPLACHPM